MTDYARYERTAVDSEGNVLTSIYCEVRRESDNGLENIYSDRTGASPLSNPALFATGVAAFHITGGVYKVRLYKTGYDETFRYVGISLSSEEDPPPNGQMDSYTVAGLPAAAASTGIMVFVTDETGGAVPAFSDGTDWRRVTDRAVVS